MTTFRFTVSVLICIERRILVLIWPPVLIVIVNTTNCTTRRTVRGERQVRPVTRKTRLPARVARMVSQVTRMVSQVTRVVNVAHGRKGWWWWAGWWWW
ncbi:hypothetical protein DPMN_029841 [Dreissena polymorpha]|uniref:Uncharacterized protein n=1 Tax=Dreissena polymorpha TaxID=45954 RepID=A0A9D4M009_DREPO|nr:hypothetical protein DPMN_029841 [Dreissena polymorpha]